MDNVNWNLKDIFENKEEFENAKKELKECIKEIKKFQGKLNNIEDLKKFYDVREKSYKIYEKLACFVALNFHQDMSNNEAMKLQKDIDNIGTKFNVASSFATPEIAENSDEKLQEFINSKELEKAKRHLEKIAKAKKHILSKEVENALTQYNEVFGAVENAYDIFTTTEMELPDVKDSNNKNYKLTHGLYSKYLAGSDRTLRENSFKALHNSYGNVVRTITELYLARVKDVIVSAKLRNYKNAIDMATDNDDSKEHVYYCLVEQVNKNLKLNHKYLKLKKKILNDELKGDNIHLYDVYRNPLGVEEENVEYEEAKKIVLNALSIMGEKYVSKLKEAMENRWIDVYEKPNKRSGAYSMGVYGVHPYILLNYVNSSRDVSTLAHELGHSMHSYFADNTQNVFNASYTIMVAEVASTVNEILLANYQINHEENKMKKAYLINEQLDMVRATLFRQTMFAEFEKIVHEKVEGGESLTSDDLNEIYYNLVKKYFGDDVVIDDEIKYEWARIPHFYTNFYVYKYSTGITSAIVIASKILNKEEGFVDKYINMLSKGGAMDSLDLLKSVGVDLEKSETYDIAFKYFKDNLETLEKLVEGV